MPTIHRLANGVTCICEERPDINVISATIHISMGSADEADDESGLTFLTQEACNGGTKTLSHYDLFRIIESRGADLATNSNRTTTTFSMSSLAADGADIFAILSDMLRNPAFDPAEVEKSKAQIIQYINQKNQKPENRKERYFMETVFGNQPVARTATGMPDLVANFTLDQIRARHAALLSDPSRIIIAFAGRIDGETARRLAEKHFGDLPAAPWPAPKAIADFIGGDKREQAGTGQLNLSIAFPAGRYQDSARYSHLMLHNLLSDGMSSPLFQEIREKRGLVYHISSHYLSSQTLGVTEITAGTGKGQARELLSATLDLLGRFVRDEIPQADLDRARKKIVRRVECSMEKASTTASRHLDQIELMGRLIPLEELDDRLRQVTSDSVRLACLDMLKGGLYAFAGVGPLDDVPTPDEIRAMMQKQVKNPPLLRPAAIAQSLSTSRNAFAAAGNRVTLTAQPPQMTTLANGMRVVTATRPGSLSVGAWTGVGSDCESERLNGASHMIEHMMFKGTKSYRSGEIDRIIEQDLLGELNAYTSKDQTAYYFYHMDAADLEKIVDICGEMVFEAEIPEDEYEGKKTVLQDGAIVQAKGERDVVLEEILRKHDDPVGTDLFDLLYATAYAGQPHGRSVIGTADRLLAMTAQDLRDYRDAAYVPNNVVFAAVGQVDHKDFTTLIDRKFGHLPPGPGLPLHQPVYRGGTVHMETGEARECRFILGAEGVAANHPDYYAYNLLGNILGSGATSRLYREIVDKRQITNGIGAFSLSYRHAGLFRMASSVPADKARGLVNAAYAELRKLADDVTQEELDRAIISNQIPLELQAEINRNACRIYAVDTLVHGAPQAPDDMMARLRAVTLDDIKAAARKILASNPVAAFVVPPGTDPALLPDHTEILAMRDGTWVAAQPKLQNPALAPRP